MITTITKVKSFLKISTTDEDDLLTMLLTAVDKDFKTRCKRDFESANYTEYYRGNGTSKLILRNYPISALTSVHDDLEREFESDTLIDADDLQISDADNGEIIYDGGIFTESEDVENVKVVYTAGYSSVPSDVEMAVIKKTAYDYMQSGGLRNTTEEELTVPSVLKKDYEETIKRYRRII